MMNEKKSKKLKSTEITSYRVYKLLLSLMYSISIFFSNYYFNLLKNSTNKIDVNFILTSGALFSTFGAALFGCFLLFNADIEKRLDLNLDILNKDIEKKETPWCRWPFLKRNNKIKALNGDLFKADIKNDIVTLDFGLYKRDFEIPSIFEDYFDLPFINNLYLLSKRKKVFITDYCRYRNTHNFEHMKYFCLLDIYWCLLKLRCIRLGIHFSVGMIFYSICLILANIL